jgi:hypothetical protein
VDGTVYDSLVWDDGNGPALYVAGAFSSAGNIPEASNIARWNGESWSMLGDGIDGAVYALEIFDDGTGPALYAGGEFETASGIEAKSLAKWDGESWSEVGGGVFGTVLSMTVSSDPFDPYLVVGGEFGFVGNVEADAIARWDGSVWHAYPDDDVFINRVTSLYFYDDGTGEKLYSGAWFTDNDPAPNDRLRRWNGSDWEQVGNGVRQVLSGISQSGVQDVIAFDDGSGMALYIGGEFSLPDEDDAEVPVARWNGVEWESLGGVVLGMFIRSGVFEFGTIEHEGDSVLVAAGDRWLNSDDETANRHIAVWDGSQWIPLGDSMQSSSPFDRVVRTISVFDLGDGDRLIASGDILRAGGRSVESIAQWDGEVWSPVGGGFDLAQTAFESIRDLEVWASKSEPIVFAAGGFDGFGETTLNRIGRFEAGAWHPLGLGMNDQVLDIEVVESNGEVVVYAAGLFTEAGGMPANRVARWDGVSWAALGDGFNSAVHDLEWFDDGSGLALYATGDFTSSGAQPISRIARWDGTTWSEVGGGLLGGGRVLEVFDDGTGPALYAGGGFVAAGGQPIARLARWDGVSWSAVGGGVSGAVLELEPAEFDGKSVLFVGGSFSTVGGMSVGSIAAWDGVTWTPFGNYFNGAEVNAIIAIDQGLFAGGQFSAAAPTRDLVRWNGSEWLVVDGGMTGFPDSLTQEIGGVRALALYNGASEPRLLVGGNFSFAGDRVSRHFAALSLCENDCPADVSGDDVVDLADLNLVLGSFGQQTASGDTNGDGVVDLADLNSVLAAFGAPCP